MILALKRQKPLTNALDGLYLPCADGMLEVHWVEGRADKLRWHTSMRGESPGAYLHPRWNGVGFHPTGRLRYIGCLYQGETILNPLPPPLDHSQWDGLYVYLNMIRVYTIIFYLKPDIS